MFNGHICRFVERDFACFFGWPNLSNRPIGGFLGLPEGVSADMQVVDIYIVKVKNYVKTGYLLIFHIG